jgi:lysophospholipid acyltransferase
MELINETTFQTAQVKARVKPGRRLPPGRVRAAYTKLFFGLVYLVAFVLYNGKYNYRVALKPEFMKHSLLMRYVFIYFLMCQGCKSLFYRILLFQLGGPFERARYYALWTLTEVYLPVFFLQNINSSIPQGASILTGLGFTGFNAKGEPQWDGAANIKVMEIEFAPNFKSILDSWNVKTHIWLRECVYKRVTPKSKKPGFTSSMITFVTSAFWVCVFLFLKKKGYSRYTLSD